MSSSRTFFIGYNFHHDLGLISEKVNILTPCPEKNVLKAFSGEGYSIYTDDNYENIWSAGNNSKGSCGVGKQQVYKLINLTPITYFNKHGIKIKKISVNPSSYGSFFISKDNKLYACGKNGVGQLGIGSNHHFIYEPVLVRDLENKHIIDIKSSYQYSIAICSNNNPKFIIIITNWSRLYSLPQDIINLIISFMKTTNVFATTTNGGTGHLKDAKIINKTGWNTVESFKDKNIIKCAVGGYHSMFLEDNGVLWTCGWCLAGRLGLGLSYVEFTKLDDMQEDYLLKPTKIPYFIKEKIVIKDIKCGTAHNIALEINGDVYSWGRNKYGQCGHGTDDKQDIYEPKLIESVKEYVIECIDCGYHHSYIKTVDKRHYLFGHNGYGECIAYNDDETKITAPFRVDQIIKSKLDAKEILQIELGHFNTKVTVSL